MARCSVKTSTRAVGYSCSSASRARSLPSQLPTSCRSHWRLVAAQTWRLLSGAGEGCRGPCSDDEVEVRTSRNRSWRRLTFEAEGHLAKAYDRAFLERIAPHTPLASWRAAVAHVGPIGAAHVADDPAPALPAQLGVPP